MSTTNHQQEQPSLTLDDEDCKAFEVVLNEIIVEPESQSDEHRQSNSHSTLKSDQLTTLQIPMDDISLQESQTRTDYSISTLQIPDISVTANCQNQENEFNAEPFRRSLSLSNASNDDRHSSTLKDTHQFGTEIKQKICLVLLSVVLLSVIGFMLKDRNAPQFKLFSAACAIIFISFYTNWIYLVARTRNLHRIKTKTKKLIDFGNIVFAVEIEESINSPVKSMSELFALRGSSVQPLFLAMCCFIAALNSAAISLHWIDTYQNATWVKSMCDKEYVELYFALCNCIATSLIGYFDLNVDDKISVFMHYLGVVLMMGSVFPFCIISHWSYLSILFAGFAFISWILWLVFADIIYPDTYEMNTDNVECIQKKVHKASLVCVLSETIGCIFASVSTVFYLWSIQDMTMLAQRMNH